MILLITVIMAVTGTTIMYFTHRDVGQAMLSAEEHAARNVLELAELNIRGGYNRLISDKIEILSTLKGELKDMTTLAASVLREFRSLSIKGIITEEEAQTLALQWLRSFEFEKGQLFVMDAKGKILAGSDTRSEGGSFAAVRDLKGRLLTNKMRHDALRSEGESAVFIWSPQEGEVGGKNMGFFFPITDWQWTIGGLVDFENIEDAPGSAIEVFSIARNPIQLDTTIKMLENQNKAKVLSNPRVTVRHNGVVVHDDVELPGERSTTAAPSKPGNAPGPIYLQNHGNPVVYRNIWVVPKSS